MNRKDTILVAVLVNMGVLLILFISSLKPHLQTDLTPSPGLALSLDSSEQIHRITPKIENNKDEKIPQEVSEAIEQLLKADEIPDLAIQGHKESNLVALEVKSGDVLGKIAKSTGSSVEEIKKINQLADDKLQTGQTLYVPSSAPKASVAEEKYYTVKNGDNPWTIATKNHIKIEELLRLNGLDESKAKKIKPGDRLRIK